MSVQKLMSKWILGHSKSSNQTLDYQQWTFCRPKQIKVALTAIFHTEKRRGRKIGACQCKIMKMLNSSVSSTWRQSPLNTLKCISCFHIYYYRPVQAKVDFLLSARVHINQNRSVESYRVTTTFMQFSPQHINSARKWIWKSLRGRSSFHVFLENKHSAVRSIRNAIFSLVQMTLKTFNPFMGYSFCRG